MLYNCITTHGAKKNIKNNSTLVPALLPAAVASQRQAL